MKNGKTTVVDDVIRLINSYKGGEFNKYIIEKTLTKEYLNTNKKPRANSALTCLKNEGLIKVKRKDLIENRFYYCYVAPAFINRVVERKEYKERKKLIPNMTSSWPLPKGKTIKDYPPGAITIHRCLDY